MHLTQDKNDDLGVRWSLPHGHDTATADGGRERHHSRQAGQPARERQAVRDSGYSGRRPAGICTWY